MTWYKKYMSIYGKPFCEVPEDVIEGTRKRLAALQSEQPLASIVIIGYNEENHLQACLWSISEMKCRYPVEIIGVDNDSSDRTAEIYQRSGIPYYTENQHSCGYARRCGLRHARGRFYLDVDSDTLYPPLYFELMIRNLLKPGVVAVSSHWSYFADKQHSRFSLMIFELCRDLFLWIQHFKRPELSVRGLVFGYNADYGRKEEYRVDLIRGEDGSMALALKKYGRIKFLYDLRARAITGYGTIGNESIWRVMFHNSLSQGRNINRIFYSTDYYADSVDNLVSFKQSAYGKTRPVDTKGTWYDKYYAIYNTPPKMLPQPIKTLIAEAYRSKNSNDPEVSVVAIAHNESKRVLACLWSLADNVCKYPMEIFVVNDDSEDDMAHVLFSMGITTIFEERRSPGYARQAGLNFARGRYFVCIDADTLYPPRFVETMVDALQSEKYSCAYSLWSFLPDGELSPFDIKIYEFCRDIYLYLQHFKRPELNVRGMAFAFKTDLARKYGFRKDIIRGEDGTLALNLKQDGAIRFVRSRKARPITDNSILKAKGSLGDAVKFRISKAFWGFFDLFYKKQNYQDTDENIIKQ